MKNDQEKRKRVIQEIRRARSYGTDLQDLMRVYNRCLQTYPKYDFGDFTCNEMADLLQIEYQLGL